jgi:hypothetical protein
VAFSTLPPLVTKTRSFSVRGIDSSLPEAGAGSPASPAETSEPAPVRSTTMRRATFFAGSWSVAGTMSKSMSTTRAPYSIVTPCSSRYLVRGRIIDSYWLYLVKRRAVKSGRPPMWWT